MKIIITIFKVTIATTTINMIKKTFTTIIDTNTTKLNRKSHPYYTNSLGWPVFDLLKHLVVSVYSIGHKNYPEGREGAEVDQ